MNGMATVTILDARRGPVDHSCSRCWQYRGLNAGGHELYLCDSGRHALVAAHVSADHLCSERCERRCANCGRLEVTAGTIRTRVIDWRTDYMCASCVASFDWSDWTFDGVVTYTRTSPSGCVLCRRIGHPLTEPCLI